MNLWKFIVLILKKICILEKHRYKIKAYYPSLPSAIIRDAGRTELVPGTVTVVAVGPGNFEIIKGEAKIFKKCIADFNLVRIV